MADFLPAYEKMILNEGGYRSVNVKSDRGGQTFAGIARKFWPNWPGWELLDRGEEPSVALVRQFYRDAFWDPLQLDKVENQSIATTVFDFAVNAGTKTAALLLQLVLGVTPDGKIGPITLRELNGIDPELFMARYALAKLARYRDIVQRDKTQIKFLVGWINRLLKEAS